MKASQQLLELLEKWEGLSQKMYLDSGGAPTIGIGHLLSKSERASGKIEINGVNVPYRNWLSEKDCKELLKQDLLEPEKTANYFIAVNLSQNQFDALLSLIFNIGRTAFQNSTLLKLLNQGRYNQVPAQMRRWVYDNGVKVPGLVNRREKEIKLWNGEAQ